MGYENNAPVTSPAKPLLFVLSGLSGAGKDTVLNGLKESTYPLEFIVTLTTRKGRPGEKDGMPYHFVTESEFRKKIDNGQLLEWASVYGNLYGVPKEPVSKALADGKDVVIKTDVQGAATIKKIVPRAVLIFLSPASIDELALRLKQRSTETPEEYELRLKTARQEMEKLPLFDYLVINRHGKADEAVANVSAIITAEKSRVKPGETIL